VVADRFLRGSSVAATTPPQCRCEHEAARS
jgi:hypothetical protein